MRQSGDGTWAGAPDRVHPLEPTAGENLIAGPDSDGGRWLIDLSEASDAELCGGKGAGLARLQRAGFAVPAAVCLTTEFHRRWLEASGVSRRLQELVGDPATADPLLRPDILAEMRAQVEAATGPDDLKAALRDGVARLREGREGILVVRSSAPYEDGADASHAGIHSSVVIAEQDSEAVVAAVKACWASLWTETAWAYRECLGVPHAAAAMAVVVQRFIAADRSGVAFSVDPLTKDRRTAVIEAAWGMGGPLVSGKLTPDEYRVTLEGDAAVGSERRAGWQEEMAGWRDGHALALAVPEAWRRQPVLARADVLELARLVKAVERSLGWPVDVEWAFDGRTFWAVQARPITTLGASADDALLRETAWTRANLKEVFPDLPSPLALSYLLLSLNLMFKSYHAAHGYALPPGARLVSVFRGRPYLNLTLMEQLTVARGGDPAVVARLFGGDGIGRRAVAAPTGPESAGIRDRARLAREMFATFFRTPSRGRRLFRMLRRKDAALHSTPLDRLDDRALLDHLEGFRTTLLHEATMRRLHEVVSAQSRAYMALEELLAAWIPSRSDALVKRLMTGLGTLPNVRMTYRLMALGTLAVRDERARSFFAGELGEDATRRYEAALAGTPFLAELEAFLREFGHRGPYESDVMSARFAEDPSPVLRLIQLYVRAGASEDPARHAAERRLVRHAATAEVREALRRGRGRVAFRARWIVFSIVCGALQRLLALRDECRHVTTLMVAHLRRVALEIGRRATRDGLLASADDVFFLCWEELPRVLTERGRDWRAMVRDRRRERERNERLAAPDLLGGDGTVDGRAADGPGEDLVGFGVSPGTVSGRVKVLRSVENVRQLSGEIVVFPAIEPTLTPIFPLVGGLIAEMGGLLSHAAILAREYGLPAVVGVRDATRRLRDGDHVELDGTTGRIRVLERAP